MADDLIVKMAQNFGCGFSPLEEYFVFLITPLPNNIPGQVENSVKARFYYDYPDNPDDFEEGIATDEAPLEWSLYHTYKAPKEGKAKYHPALLIDGAILKDEKGPWRGEDATKDNGPWEIWVIDKNPFRLYFGQDEVVTTFPLMKASLTGSPGIKLERKADAWSSGEVQADFFGETVGVKVLGQEVGFAVDELISAEFGLEKMRIDAGCTIQTTGMATLTFDQAIDASAGLYPNIVSVAKASFAIALNDGSGPTTLNGFPDTITAGAGLYNGKRWKNDGRIDVVKTEYDEGAKDLTISAKYTLSGSGDGLFAGVGLSMGKDSTDWSNGIDMTQTLTFMGLKKLTIDWENDNHGWQVD